MRSVLITGGSGFFGTAFVRGLLGDDYLRPSFRPKRVVVFSRGEHRQAEMERELKEQLPWYMASQLRFFIGDVRDRDRLRRAMEDIDVVVHAAALKRIEVGAYNPMEVMKTNILGAANVIEAAKDAGVRKIVALSTDKAYQPVSPYGTSKAFAESLFLAANNTTGNRGPRIAVVRYGNVWASTGSVVPVWRSLIEKQAYGRAMDAIPGDRPIVPVTDPDCTRFFMTIGDAVKLVIETIETMKGGEIVIPTLNAYRLGDLAEAMGAQMNVTGLPAFEKKHESMGPGNSSETARRMTVAELREALK